MGSITTMLASRYHKAPVNVQGDGNCAYRSVLMSIAWNDVHHILLRQTCVGYVAQHWNDFQAFVQGYHDRTFTGSQEYSEWASQNGIWAGYTELLALTLHFHIRLTIHHCTPAPELAPASDVPTMLPGFQLQPAAEEWPELHLLHEESGMYGHYQALRGLQGQLQPTSLSLLMIAYGQPAALHNIAEHHEHVPPCNQNEVPPAKRQRMQHPLPAPHSSKQHAALQTAKRKHSDQGELAAEKKQNTGEAQQQGTGLQLPWTGALTPEFEAALQLHNSKPHAVQNTLQACCNKQWDESQQHGSIATLSMSSHHMNSTAQVQQEAIVAEQPCTTKHNVRCVRWTQNMTVALLHAWHKFQGDSKQVVQFMSSNFHLTKHQTQDQIQKLTNCRSIAAQGIVSTPAAAQPQSDRNAEETDDSQQPAPQNGSNPADTRMHFQHSIFKLHTSASSITSCSEADKASTDAKDKAAFRCNPIKPAKAQKTAPSQRKKRICWTGPLQKAFIAAYELNKNKPNAVQLVWQACRTVKQDVTMEQVKNHMSYTRRKQRTQTMQTEKQQKCKKGRKQPQLQRLALTSVIWTAPTAWILMAEEICTATTEHGKI